MTDTAKLLCGPIYVPTAAAAVYTAAAGVTPIIRNLHINNASGANYWFSIGINATPVTASNSIYYQFQVPQYSAFDWSGFMALPVGGSLWAIAQSASALTIVVSGVEIS